MPKILFFLKLQKSVKWNQNKKQNICANLGIHKQKFNFFLKKTPIMLYSLHKCWVIHSYTYIVNTGFGQSGMQYKKNDK
jgi:hypothetical protein